MNPFVRLGLSLDADEAQVRRAYARLLRSSRPDDDPAGFQQLNEAYQYCLAWARQRAPAAVELGIDLEPAARERRVQAPDFGAEPRVVAPPAPAPRPVPTPPPPPPFARRTTGGSAHAAARPDPLFNPVYAQAAATPAPDAAAAFDLAGFLDQLNGAARTQAPDALRRWLDHHPDLYALDHQHAVARALVAHLSSTPSLYIAQLDIVLRFFGLDRVSEDTSPIQARIDELRARAKARGEDFREIEFQRNPRPGARGKHPISLPWGVVGFFLMMLALSIVKAMRAAHAG